MADRVDDARTFDGQPEQGKGSGRRVALSLLVVGALGAAAFGFLGFAPNRILSAAPIFLWQAQPPLIAWSIAAGAVIIVGGLAIADPWFRQLTVLAGATLVLLATIAGAGAGATATLATATSAAARVSLGAAFWLIALTSALAIADALGRLGASLAVRFAFGMAIVAVVAALALGGRFNDLSLVHEWSNRRDAYSAAFGEHLTLVVTSLLIALVIGVPLGIAAAARPERSPRIFTALNLVQTIPSIALFGLLIGPLTSLSDALPALRDIGVNGIGFTPAVTALVLYALLPVARNTEAGILSVPASAIETARGMGMTAFQVLLHVSFPLALPVLLAGLRIVTVQLIGLAVVAALIGAGGFGSFVFLGLGQTATDLVLLGALSAIAMALIADGALRVLTQLALRSAAP